MYTTQHARCLNMAMLMVFVVCIFLLVGDVTRAALTGAQNASTLAFLQSFTVSMPDLADVWTGDEWCTWPYISCNSDTSTTLVIDNAGFTGSLPELQATVNGANVALTEIAVTNMNITGGFKDTWGGLTRVRVLNFTNTNLFGTIPMGWNAMRSLETVILKNCSACGSLPHWTLRGLKNIDVSQNVLRGPLPNTWGNIAGLQTISLVDNHFCGCKPPSWVSRALTNALFQAMGSGPFNVNCRSPTNCASEGARCSLAPPQYHDAAAPPPFMLLPVLTLILALMAIYAV
ncbi:hypothetical protein Q4I32_001483 [Leishmania shawi]|uniref:Surface antigen-like protein n=2 Tax=Leishmania guyanensis species complex TaxID=38579 RepID=A0AAW3C8G7_9TRYP|nr:Putative surface antigen-like protein [Leishmania guyanensis]